MSWRSKGVPLLVLACSLITCIRFFQWIRQGSDNEMVDAKKLRDGLVAKNQPTLRRFPAFGSSEFSRTCPWTLPTAEQTSCTIFVRPPLEAWEGMAQWLSQIASGFMLTQQIGCRLVFDYGRDVDIQQVITPQSFNWTVPSGMDTDSCNASRRCHCLSDFGATIENELPSIRDNLAFESALVNVPFYRDYYIRSFEPDQKELRETLPGFQTEFGFACAMGALIQLSPQADNYEPSLFSRTIPILRDEKALVIALYIRTGLTDRMARDEQEGKTLPYDDKDRHASQSKPFLKCAEALEKEKISYSFFYEKIVWLIITDSSSVKAGITRSHNGSQAIYERTDGTFVKIPREVAVTSTRGKHTRLQAHPSSKDFAEAFIDFYLLGESDLVIARHKFTYGKIAALRTGRPLYDAAQCKERVPEYLSTRRSA